MAKPKKKKRTRRQRIDTAVEQAVSGPKKTKVKPKPKKNPYPAGSARAKLWKRREANRKKKKGK